MVEHMLSIPKALDAILSIHTRTKNVLDRVSWTQIETGATWFMDGQTLRRRIGKEAGQGRRGARQGDISQWNLVWV